MLPKSNKVAGMPPACHGHAEIGSAIAECKGLRRDLNTRLIAVCYAGDPNLNAWLIAEGWALAYRSQSLAHVQAQETAREQAKGPLGRSL
jgi:endonuclease YncB( thermonuclease family)